MAVLGFVDILLVFNTLNQGVDTSPKAQYEKLEADNEVKNRLKTKTKQSKADCWFNPFDV